MDKSVVSVKIYGQEYTVSGDKSREYIIKVADYVDQNMREIAAVAAGIPAPSLAVLASVNIADQYFETAARLSVQEEKCAEQEKYRALYKAVGRSEEKLCAVQGRSGKAAPAERRAEADIRR